MYKNPSLDKKNFTGETTDMNGQLFQTIEESRDATQYVKTVEALECYAFKNYAVDLSPLFQRNEPQMPVIEIPEKPTNEEINENPTKADIYQLDQRRAIVKSGTQIHLGSNMGSMLHLHLDKT